MDSPALPAPLGVIPDLANPPSERQHAVLAASIVLLIFPTVFLSLRCYVRVFILKKWGLADYICVLAWSLLVVLISLGFSTLKLGNGIHGYYLSLAHFSKFGETLNDQQIIYVAALLLTKTAILLQLMEIFVPHTRTPRWWILVVLITLNAIYFTINLFLEVFVCVPREKIWNPTVPGHCINLGVLFITSAAVNLGEDIIILVLPISWILRLQVNLKRRIGISVVYATGLFACVSSAMRLVESVKTVNDSDITYALVPVYLWAVAEVASGLIICCLPFIPRFFRRPQLETSKGGSGKGTDNQHSLISGRKVYHELEEISLQPSAAATSRIETTASREPSGDWQERGNPVNTPRPFLYRGDLEKGLRVLDDPTHQQTLPRPEIVRTVSISQKTGPTRAYS